MNPNIKTLFFVLLLLAPLFIFGQQDVLSIADLKNIHFVSEEYNQEYDGAPGLFIFMILMLIFILICIGIGIALTILILVLFFGLIAIGLISSSLLVGIYNKSFLKGFKIFIIGGSTIGCIILGIVSFIIYNKIVHYWSLQTATLVGFLSGSVAGLLLGIILFYTIRKLTAAFYSKVKVKET